MTNIKSFIEKATSFPIKTVNKIVEKKNRTLVLHESILRPRTWHRGRLAQNQTWRRHNFLTNRFNYTD